MSTETAGTAALGTLVSPARGGFWHWFSKVFFWWLLPLPLVHAVVVHRLSDHDLLIFASAKKTKALFEVVHPSILIGMILLSFQGWRLTRQFELGWMTLFACCLFVRELHFYGSGPILVGGTLLLLFVAIKRPAERNAFVRQRLAASLFFVGLWCYFWSQILDRGIIEYLGGLIIGNPDWEMGNGSNMEESMESLGGLLLMLTPLAMKRRSAS